MSLRHKFALEPGSPGNPALTQFADSANLDAFSRLRVSNPQTTFETQCQYDLDHTRMETGVVSPGFGADGVAPAHSANTRMVELRVAAGAAGGISWIQSFHFVPYQPGKSQAVFVTGVLGAGTTGAVKRFGYGSNTNGIFYEQSGTTLQFNRRTTTSGATVDNLVTQANWNIDRFDGTGPSGKTIDATKCFILSIDLQFLGMGRVRVGFDIDGVLYYAHQFLNANVLSVPYMQTATLPIRAEVEAAAGLALPAVAHFKCASVTSEGGYDISHGRDFSTQGSITAPNGGALVNILALQPRTTFNGLTNRGLFIPESMEILAGNVGIVYQLCIGVTYAVAPVFGNVNTTYSFMNKATGGTTPSIATGIVVFSGFIPSGAAARGLHSEDLGFLYPITLDRNGAVRNLGTLTLLINSTGADSACSAAFNWKEVRGLILPFLMPLIGMLFA